MSDIEGEGLTDDKYDSLKKRIKKLEHKHHHWRRISIGMFVVSALLIAILFASFGMVIYSVDQIDNNLVTDVEVIDIIGKRDEDMELMKDLTETERISVYDNQLTFKKSGKKLQIYQQQQGLAVLKSGSLLAAANIGVTDLVGSTGTTVVPTLARSIETEVDKRSEEDDEQYETMEETERTSVILVGKKLAVASTGVLGVTSSLPLVKKSEEERIVIPPSSSGITATTTAQAVNLINTGILTLGLGNGLYNSGSSQDPILQLSSNLIYVSTTIAYTDLASAGVKTLYTASSPTATYIILDIATLATGSTNFAGGNRTVDIGTSAVTKYFVSSAALGTVATTSLVKSVSNTGIQPSTTSNSLTATVAGANIVAQYAPTVGTVDYTSGLVEITMVLIQTSA